ncbi:hypothetical protein BTO09_07510 [Gilvibacter sp. SZ-19]|nr:hypothetical protein BTO09_07510 [Gilvibacter sp. SZ-19]
MRNLAVGMGLLASVAIFTSPEKAIAQDEPVFDMFLMAGHDFCIDFWVNCIGLDPVIIETN